MPRNLLIVESPAKAKTIEKILGKDFSVKSSFGHVRDLPKEDISVDVKNNFLPKYVIPPDKHKVVKELKEAVSKSEEVWLATDEDREGEAISWHLCKVLGLDERTTKRIVFHEITKPAIQAAVAAPRLLDLNLVDAQQSRRVVDRLVGYELSELLWKKIKGGLSAGRVQSVAVRLVVDREREIQNFNSTPFFKITADFLVKNAEGKLVTLKSESPTKYDVEQDAEAFLRRCIGANYSIRDIEVKPAKRKPAPPFTTSTLQQEASRKLSFPVNKTMSVAQRLYEAGHITYMRTDSTNLSEMAIGTIAQEIENLYGQRYVQTRRFKTNKAGAQEAHEAIRPTYINVQTAGADRDQQRLYELIWKRTIACQMADAELERTIVKIAISTQPDTHLQAEGEVLKFDGFLKVYLESSDDDEETGAQGMLPPLKVGQPLDLDNMTATERYTRPPARYSEAALVSKLEELGIGRPSTYAPTISKIMEENRGYVVKENRDGEERIFKILILKGGNINKTTGKENTGAVKQRLFPTDMGAVVTDYLYEHFKDIMDYGFTAEIEKQFDTVAEGGLEWSKMVGGFYHPFHQKLADTLETSARATGERTLGKDPASGHTVLVRMTKNGRPAVQLGTKEELGEEKPRFANLSPGMFMESITLEQALKLFEMSKAFGQYEGKEVSVGNGRFGPYVKHGDTFISIPRNISPADLTMEMAVQLIQEKQAADAPMTTYKGTPVTKGKGRFGPFIKWGELFINIPAKYKLETLTPEQAYELIEAKVNKEANRYIQQWEKEEIAIENGRWGPFIRYKKNNIAFPKIDGKKVTDEDVKQMPLEEVKKIIEAAMPGLLKK